MRAWGRPLRARLHGGRRRLIAIAGRRVVPQRWLVVAGRRLVITGRGLVVAGRRLLIPGRRRLLRVTGRRLLRVTRRRLLLIAGWGRRVRGRLRLRAPAGRRPGCRGGV